MAQLEHPNPLPIASIAPDDVDARLAVLHARESARRADREIYAPYFARAAVLESFDAATFLACLGIDAKDAFLGELMRRVETLDDGRWRLDLPLRREMLGGLSAGEAVRLREEMARAAPHNRMQEALDRALSGSPSDVSALDAEQTSASLVVHDWVDGIVAVPDKEPLLRHLERERLLQPLRQLTGSVFVGRAAEMAKLADHVGVLPPEQSGSSVGRRFARRIWRSLLDNPPIYVAGPGGVGKSSLVSKFILDHVDGGAEGRLPFVILDFDRTLVDSDEPLSLLAVAAQQLKVQYPAKATVLERVGDQLEQRIASRDKVESNKSDSLQIEVVKAFADEVNKVLEEDHPDKPLLWVLDTFEEPQRKGESTVGALWDLLDELQRNMPKLRVVVCGRVVPAGSFNWDVIHLQEFDDESAVAFLSKRLQSIAGPQPEAAELDSVVKAVGRTPLALRLAARLISDAGVGELQNVETRSMLLFSLRAEQIQAALFHRVLEHIRVVDPHARDVYRQALQENLRRLAFPGLAVRRVTPDVILHVLCEPCGISPATPEFARDLYDQLARQVDIVEPDTLDAESALAHRNDIRRMMLKGLAAHADGATIDAINKAAVAYYEKRGGLRDRAEEIYHLLRLGAPEETIQERWNPGIERFLQGAIDDVETRAQRVVLAEKLHIELEASELAEVSQEKWESQAQLRAARYIQSALPERALQVLRERAERLGGNELLKLEAQALHMLRDEQAALAVALRGLQDALEHGKQAWAIELALLASQIEELQHNLEEALALATHASSWAERARDPLGRVQAGAACARLLRKMAMPETRDARVALSTLVKKIPREQLRARPALVRELVSEVGSLDVEFVQFGIDLLGVDLDTQDFSRLADVLGHWGLNSDEETRSKISGIAQSLGILGPQDAPPVNAPLTEVPFSEAIEKWLDKSGGKQAGRFLLALLRETSAPSWVVDEIVGLFKREANRRILRETRQRLL